MTPHDLHQATAAHMIANAMLPMADPLTCEAVAGVVNQEMRAVHQMLMEVRREKAAVERELQETKNKLAQEEMNGLCIMECRMAIQRHLGANAAASKSPNGNMLASPFFDDLVYALIHEIKKLRGEDDMNFGSSTSASLAQLNVYVTVNDGYASGTPLMWASAITSSIKNNNFIQMQLSGQTTTPTLVTNQMANSIAKSYQSYGSTPAWVPEEAAPFAVVDGKFKLHDGRACKVTMPDGSLVDLKADGSYEIIDKDAKIIYRACKVRDFNRFLNASDLLEDFIRFCGEHGTRQDEMLSLPIKLFIGWLILKAAEADGEELSDPPAIETDLRYPRCGCCGRFISKRRRELRIAFCSEPCIERAMAAPKERYNANRAATSNRRKAKDNRPLPLDDRRAA